ncbi:MAG: glycosyltransferase family 4 protein [Nitrospira sp.]|nr:glycosyltransferase family 4 protein [Nitrospira sp.]MCA9468491.1 glycosyltransferase family 4 protein [Nitrospira sp.]MCB9776693.1 glycosyltransferase family 4 protein [Nitrospiraceae bacterium]
MSEHRKIFHVLISAYACEPHKGSEPGVGWNIAKEMAKHCKVWVLTRANNQESIDQEIDANPIENIHFVFYDLPIFFLKLKRGQIGLQLYYYFWQIGSYFVARKLHQSVKFDLAHHVTFVKYWAPSLMALLPIPFLWGPVGGGESTPKPFTQEFSRYGQIYERFRDWAKWFSEKDPLVRLTAQRSRISLSTTPETAQCLTRLGASRVEILTQCGIGKTELENFAHSDRLTQNNIIFLSIGNLLHLKGFHLSLKAFKMTKLKQAEYWIIGDGPERHRLQDLVHTLDITRQVHFLGRLSHRDTLSKINSCDILLHPSLHESGGGVCVEAMAAGIPVICLDEGGPGSLVTPAVGIKIPILHPHQVIKDMSEAMVDLVQFPEHRLRLGQQGKEYVTRQLTWEKKGHLIFHYYCQMTDSHLRPYSQLTSPSHASNSFPCNQYLSHLNR